MRSSVLVFSVLLACQQWTAAGVIRVLPAGGGHLISAHSPIGQTFTAEDSRVTAGLYVFSLFPSADTSLLVQLFQGAGVAGPVLDFRILTPPQGFSGYIDVNYAAANVVLAPGHVYTLTLSAIPGSGWVSASSYDFVDAYPGGVAVISGTLHPTNIGDKAFEVVPVVPEPGSFLVAGIILAGILVTHRTGTNLERRSFSCRQD